MRTQELRTCDFCKDDIRLDGTVRIKENGRVRFIFDVGCAMLLGVRKYVKVKGNEYKLISS